MKFQLLRGVSALTLTACALHTLTGCGGGGSSAPSATGSVTRAALTGTVQAPQSQTRAIHITRDADPLVSVPNAAVALINLDDTSTPNGKVVDSTTTNSSGSYTFNTLTPGTNYKIEATKAVGSKTLTLDAIVTAPPPAANGTTAPPPVAHDLTPDSTVAAVVVIQQAQAFRASDPTGKQSLQALADDLAQKAKDANTPPPDLTDATAIAAGATALKQLAAPKGSYAGMAITTAVSAANTQSKIGDSLRLAAQIDGSGHFFLAAFSSSTNKTNASAANSTSTGSGSSGTDTSGGGDNIAIGSVTSDGLVSATTKDGKVKLTGLFTSGVGTGTWAQADGSESGTWSLVLLKTSYAGLYAGVHTGSGGSNGSSGGNGSGTGSGSGSTNGSGTGGSPSGSSTVNKGDFALLILDDNSAYIAGSGGNNGSGDSSISGTGTVSSTGALTFIIVSQDGSTVTGTGQIDVTTHTVTGTYSSTSGDTGQFTGRSNLAVTSDL